MTAPAKVQTGETREKAPWHPEQGRPRNGWTVTTVQIALRHAMDIVRRMPSRDSFPRGYAAYWPTIRQKLFDDGHLSALARMRDREFRQRIKKVDPPTGREIDFADRTIPWFFLLPDLNERRIVSARASGVPIRDIAAWANLSHETVRRRHDKALASIVNHLEG